MTYPGNSTFLYSANDTYINEMYARYHEDRALVTADWAIFFDTLSEAETEADAHISANSHGVGAGKASWSDDHSLVVGQKSEGNKSLSDSLSEANKSDNPIDSLIELLQQHQKSSDSTGDFEQARMDSIRALMLIRAYRTVGHMRARLDPLDLTNRDYYAGLDPANHGFGPNDYDRVIFLNYYMGLKEATLREIIAICEKSYCGSIGVEFTHIQDSKEKLWLQMRTENAGFAINFTPEEQATIFQQLVAAEGFEGFLNKKFPGNKRFGLDGGEALVPVLEEILHASANAGVEDINIGMAHRGRLNVLANIMKKPYRAIFAEFKGLKSNTIEDSSGDVKYHLGTSSDREFGPHSVHLSLNPNPSHLECINTIILGKVRAKLEQRDDSTGATVLPILLHGDAAFIGQGIVAETFLLSQLKGYRVGGTIHIALNNQIGFTTSPHHSRSSPYCSDMAKMINAPVFHVNGDDPEACVRVARLAAEYRKEFHKDVVIDLYCYRRYGHNEGDQPLFTQPLMYKKIKDHPTCRTIYGKYLEENECFAKGNADKLFNKQLDFLEEEFQAAESYRRNKNEWMEGSWAGISIAEAGARRGDTGCDIGLLREVGFAISQVPKNFNIHGTVKRFVEQRRQMINGEMTIDWAMAEALAFGTLLCQSTTIRLSGEDSQRGTFSQRHSVLIDQENEHLYVPLNNIRRGQAPFKVINSPLSEFGLLGFEYGFATTEPHALVLWEAQFGDFANGAQVIIDQFIASGETKWLRMCGLIMLLPHGYEGQGPEHSSARLERFLQLSAQDNWQVCNVTTPSNYFHVLRRQIRRSFRKPLILMSPKSLLRHPLCRSRLEELGPDTTFHRVLYDDAQWVDELAPDTKIRRVVLCSGKVYFDLFQERAERKIDDIQILRVEQLYPFPDDVLEVELKRFPNAEVIWCQEEPKNGGGWDFVNRRIENVLDKINHKPNQRLRYAGRGSAASPASGTMAQHVKELAGFLDDALKK